MGTSKYQRDVFEKCNFTNDVLDGINSCIIAYGQTSSGKTHSLFGSNWMEEPISLNNTANQSEINNNNSEIGNEDNLRLSSSSDNYYRRSRSTRSSSSDRRMRHSSAENEYDYRNPHLAKLPPPPDPLSTLIDYRESSKHHERSRRSDKHSSRRSRSRSSSRDRRALRKNDHCDVNDDLNDLKWIHDRHSIDEPE